MRHAAEAPEDPAEPSGEELRASSLPRTPYIPRKVGALKFIVMSACRAEDCGGCSDDAGSARSVQLSVGEMDR